MPETHTFRRELRGFNREDVVAYIDYLNKKNASLVNQLKAENRGLKDELAALRSSGADAGKDALIAELEQKLLSAPKEPTESELEAYRRAERAERIAQERADQIYRQAAATLAEASAQVDGAAGEMSALADQVAAHITALQAAVTSSKEALQAAAATMYAIRPEETAE